MVKKNIQIRHQNPLMFRKNIFRIQFFEPEAFPAAVICSVPEKTKHLIGQIIQQILVTVKNQEKGNVYRHQFQADIVGDQTEYRRHKSGAHIGACHLNANNPL